MGCFIHEKSEVLSPNIGEGTRIGQYCVILPEAVTGENCNVCAHVLIENDVEVGDNVTIKSGVQLWDGMKVEDDVFVGPNVTFANDLVPRSKHYPDRYKRTLLKKGCSVGANSTIIAGVTIGEYALVGAGSVVTKDVPPNTVWYGNPARFVKYITNEGMMFDKKQEIEQMLEMGEGGKCKFQTNAGVFVLNLNLAA